jgi:ArsR family transcriptional regulator
MGMTDSDHVIRYADMFSAMGTEPRLRIMQLLLSAHPMGLVPVVIQSELGIRASTLSHHLDRLKNEGLVKVRRESTFLWYTASTEALQELLGFLYAECCTRNKAIHPEKIASYGGQVAEAVTVGGELTAVSLRVHPAHCGIPSCDCDSLPEQPADATSERRRLSRPRARFATACGA